MSDRSPAAAPARSGSRATRARLACVAAAALGLAVALAAAAAPWLDAEAPEVGAHVTLTGFEAIPALGTAALAGFAAALALLMSSGIMRRVVATVGSLISLGALALVLALLANPGDRASHAISDQSGLGLGADAVLASVAPVAWISVAGSVVAFVGFLAAAVLPSGSWPRPTRRFDRSGAAASRAAAPVDDWTAISEGHDPTDDPRDAGSASLGAVPAEDAPEPDAAR